MLHRYFNVPNVSPQPRHTREAHRLDAVVGQAFVVPTDCHHSTPNGSALAIDNRAKPIDIYTVRARVVAVLRRSGRPGGQHDRKRRSAPRHAVTLGPNAPAVRFN